MSQIGKFLNLHPHMQSWAVYNVNGPYTKDYKIGDVLPAQFGGLSYMILDEKGGDVYVIQTESFGKCAIWAPNDPDSNISFERTYLNGDTNGSGGGTLPPDGTGTYLNLHGHMQSWAVYNVSGPYTTGYQIGFLAPAQFGGLSYRILEEKGGDVYIIQTELFGRCAIWAPRDPDSSITSSPLYDNGDTSGGGSNPPGGGNGGIEIPGGLKVFIDPGHGGYDPGALRNGLQEKDIVLAISKRLGVILNSYGISVKYSRETDTFIDLDPRAQQANNWGANLFVSIHANSATASASGTECYTKPAADSKTKQLSANVAKSISSKLGIPNRGHKEEVWRVLMSSNMPAILVETAFITNSGDANLLKNRQDDFANAIANEILNYYGSTSNGGSTGKYLNLKPHMQSWAVYNVDGPYTTAYKIGNVLPAKSGGLSFRIIEEKGNDIYIIQTLDFGKCAIWAPSDPDSSITSSPEYSLGEPKDITQALKDLLVRYMYMYGPTWNNILAPIEKLYKFYNLVKNNGMADLKNQGWTDSYYIFNGNTYRGDAPGNILYGQLGKAFGFSDELLFRAAGYAQFMAGTNRPEWGHYLGESPYGDDPYDQFCIQVGISYYKKNYN